MSEHTLTDAEFEALRTVSPFDIFCEWFAVGERSEPVNPNAMTLATVDESGMPQARTVLLKSYSKDGFIFYTNSKSRKGEALACHPKAALLFYWRSVGRQILIEGDVRRMTAAETEPYFHSRPLGSRIGVWASAQSRPLASFADFYAAIADRRHEFAGDSPPLPPYWRGYIVVPTRIEFWQEGEYRLHRRLAFERRGSQEWQASLLFP